MDDEKETFASLTGYREDINNDDSVEVDLPERLITLAPGLRETFHFIEKPKQLKAHALVDNRSSFHYFMCEGEKCRLCHLGYTSFTFISAPIYRCLVNTYSYGVLLLPIENISDGTIILEVTRAWRAFQEKTIPVTKLYYKERNIEFNIKYPRFWIRGITKGSRVSLYITVSKDNFDNVLYLSPLDADFDKIEPALNSSKAPQLSNFIKPFDLKGTEAELFPGVAEDLRHVE